MEMFSSHLITYPATTYDWTDLKRKIDTEMESRQCQSVVLHDQNTYQINDVGFLDVVAFHVYSSLNGFQWRRFLARQSKRKHIRLVSFFQDLDELLRGFVGVTQIINPNEMILSRKACLRSMNISASHLAAWREALSADCKWAIVFEDDGSLESTDDLTATLDFLEGDGNANRKLLVNLSQSFRFSALGVQEIIESSTVQAHVGRSQEVILTTTPFTNTLCAVAISRSLLDELVPFVAEAVRSRRFRGIAIDFLFNRFLLERSEELDISSIHLNPGVVRQGSIVRKKPLQDLR